jgi:putative holliday junction resolvase
MRYVAIDLGDQRTGVAVGDSLMRMAGPVEVIEVPIAERGGEALLAAIVGAVAKQVGPPSRGGAGAEVVIGLPLNMDGSEGPKAKQVREFGARIAAGTGRVVRYQDERLSTVDADWTMARSGLTRKQKKGRRDALAAAAILKDFLASLPASGPEPQG